MNPYHSSVLGRLRQFYVYTPPDYEKNASALYPALYLLHGAGDTEGEWTWHGRANHILDNLLADGKMRPMIVVMPFGHATNPNDFSAPRARNTELFEADLKKDIIPRVEAKYRTAPGPANRAIAGLSMGGAQSINVGLSNLDLFGHIGVFSAGSGFGPGAREEFEKRYQAVLADPAATNKKIRLLWIGCGEQDQLIQGAQQLSDTLKQHGITHTFRTTPGAHTWIVWRRYLAEVAPLLFRPAS